jgi:transcription antitermination factor NusG
MNPAWYVARVRSRSEERVNAILNQKNVETFSPCWKERRAYSDRIRKLSVPAFPGYVFCRIDLRERLRVVDTPGVQYLVGATRPEAIHDNVIMGLQKAFSQSDHVAPVEYLKTGDMVCVLDGPLAGTAGMLLRTKGTQRLIISVDVLHRSVAVEVDAASVIMSTTP